MTAAATPARSSRRAGKRSSVPMPPGEVPASAGPSQAPYGPLSILLAFAFLIAAWLFGNQSPPFSGFGEIALPLLFLCWLGAGIFALRHRQGGWFALGAAIVILPFL